MFPMILVEPLARKRPGLYVAITVEAAAGTNLSAAIHIAAGPEAAAGCDFTAYDITGHLAGACAGNPVITAAIQHTAAGDSVVPDAAGLLAIILGLIPYVFYASGCLCSRIAHSLSSLIDSAGNVLSQRFKIHVFQCIGNLLKPLLEHGY